MFRGLGVGELGCLGYWMKAPEVRHLDSIIAKRRNKRRRCDISIYRFATAAL